jgi:hypothetical protein
MTELKKLYSIMNHNEASLALCSTLRPASNISSAPHEYKLGSSSNEH